MKIQNEVIIYVESEMYKDVKCMNMNINEVNFNQFSTAVKVKKFCVILHQIFPDEFTIDYCGYCITYCNNFFKFSCQALNIKQ